MSLLEDNFEDFTIINKAIIDDGLGGTKTTWTDGAVIKGIVPFNGSTQTKIAQAMGVTSVYSLVVRKETELDYHTVLRRNSDGQIFRLTSNTDDKKTPNGVPLNLRMYDAEQWEIPS